MNRKFMSVIAVFSLLFTATLQAQIKTFVPLSATEGLLIVSQSAITIERVPIQNIGIVTPVPNPNPTDPASRALTYKLAAVKINDPATAKQLESMYLGLVEYIKITPTATRTQLEIATDGMRQFFLRDQETAKRWKPVTDQFQADWVKLSQEAASVKDYEALFTDAANGLGASAPNNAAMFIDPVKPDASGQAITPAKIQKIIQMIIANGGKPLDVAFMVQLVLILLSP